MPAAAILDRAQQDRAAPHATILAVEGVTKSFPGVLALDDVSFTVRAGEVNALVCENGAGKSTLIKLMAGFYAPDAGTITVSGVPLRPDPAAAHEAGVATGDSEKAASAMLVANRGLKGIWAVWDVPGEGVIAAARTAGLTVSDLTMTTCDLGANIAIDMAQDGYTKGTGSQWPIAQARAEAKLAAYGLLGKAAPAYVALPAVPVTKDNILDAWKQVHGVEAPALVKQAAN